MSFSIPPADKVLVVAALVYGLLQGAKKLPWFTSWLNRWWAIAFNITLTCLGLFVGPTAISASQLYTQGTFTTVIMVLLASLSSAGIHGTAKSLKEPTVLATTPPSTQVKEVAATLIPDNPADVVVPKKPS